MSVIMGIDLGAECSVPRVTPKQWRKEEQSLRGKKVRKTVKESLRRLNSSGIRSGQEREGSGEIAHPPVHSSHTQRKLWFC